MKEEINLLPVPQQQQRRTQLYLYRLGQLLRRADLALIVLAGIVVAIYLGMESVSGSLATRATVPLSENTESAARIAEVNTLLATVDEYRQASDPWTTFVARVLAVMPADMQLTGLRVDAAAQQLTLAGRFTSRDSVVEYQRRLSTVDGVENVEAPLSNFATGGINNFSFTLTRK